MAGINVLLNKRRILPGRDRDKGPVLPLGVLLDRICTVRALCQYMYQMTIVLFVDAEMSGGP